MARLHTSRTSTNRFHQSPLLQTEGHNPPPPLVIANGNAVPEDDFSKDLRGAWTSATTAPKVSKVDKVLLQLENGAAGAMEKQTKGAVIMEGIKTGLEVVGGMEVIEQGLNSFMEGMPVLMNALDEVAKASPSSRFIGVAVMAFKAVWALEQKRRENDRRIIALHMEMKDMMGVLTQLKNVKDAEEVAPDGTTIKGRMQEIVKGTADDIKAVQMKKLVVKVLKGPIWEGRLVKFVGAFTKRRGEGPKHGRQDDAGDERQDGHDDEDCSAQMVSPEQKEMARLVEQRGGQAVLDNDKALKELNDMGEQIRTKHDRVYAEIEVQKRQIIPFTAYGKRWAGVAASRRGTLLWHCVTISKRKLLRVLMESLANHPTIVIDEAGYVGFGVYQAISEAFDDDASGFVTVAEVNAFTTARPLDWRQVLTTLHRLCIDIRPSLPRWIAYWAIGYAVGRLNEGFKPSIRYLDMVYQGVYTLTASLNGCYVNEALHARFSSYIESEEARIRGKSRFYGNLEAVQYDIDASDTLELVTGEGRIDRYALPVIYLLLERHFEIFRVCQTRVVSPDELWDAAKRHKTIDAAKILNHPLADEPLDFAAYTVTITQSNKPTRRAALCWPARSVYGTDTWMCSMDLQPSSTSGEGDDVVQLFNRPPARANRTDFKIAGKARMGMTPGTYYTGTWDAATETLSGKFSYEEEPEHPEQVSYGWSWSYFKERRDNRKRFIELYIRSTKFGPPMSDEEWEDLSRVKKTLTTSDSRFYHSLAEAQIRATD
ncbi:hypothetical protein B0H14DRAFT_2631247 [Mycena olivaceomarginata]|nr:hypothetical protein B0H14DRAFT_2631247 [Mycena olivaceomarginata]